jgi:tetratricopeptide (TPR) repeat protein
MQLLLGPFAEAAIDKAADGVAGFGAGTSRTYRKLAHDSVRQTLIAIANMVEDRLRQSGMTDDGIRQLQCSFSDFIRCGPVSAELARCFTELTPDFTPDHALIEREWKARQLPDQLTFLSGQDVAKQLAAEAMKRRVFPVLLTWQDFYAGEVERHATTKFNDLRVEKGRTTRPLDAISEFIAGTKPILVIHGTGGMGKSRLLMAAAEEHPAIRFVQTRLSGSNMLALAEAVKSQATGGDILVLDDCHTYRELVEMLLGAALHAKARVIMAGRYREWIVPAIKNCNLQPEELALGPVDDAAAMVPAEKGAAESINRIARGNLMLAVMAYNYWQRHQDLAGIEDRFDLLDRIVEDIARTGNDQGVADATDFLAELAVRNGLRDTAKSLRRHKTLVVELRTMGFVTSEPRGERTFCRIYPDRLRDYVIQTTYEKSGVLQPAFDSLLERLPLDEATSVIAMLAIQHKETRDETWRKPAGGRLLDAMAKKLQAGDTGFTDRTGERKAELVVEIGVAAFTAFGDWRFVVNHLRHFSAEAARLRSIAHLDLAGNLFLATGLLERSRACYERALRFAQGSGNKERESVFLHQLARLALRWGDYAEARRLCDRSLAIDPELGNKTAIARTLGQLASRARDQGDFDEAQRSCEQSLAINEELGNRSGIAVSYHQLARLALRRDDFAEARKLCGQSLAIAQELADKRAIAMIIRELANVACLQGDHAEARKLSDQSLAITEELGDKAGIALTVGQRGRLDETEKDDRAALSNYLTALSIFEELRSPYCGLARKDIARMRERLGNEAFKKLHDEVVAELERPTANN